MKTLRLLVLFICGVLTGCYVVDFARPEGKPSNQWVYDIYRRIEIKKSNAADVLMLFGTPDFAFLSQSKSAVVLAGRKKQGYKMWFDMVCFEENDLIANRKYVFISDEKPKQLFVEPWEGVYFDCQMVLPKKILDEPYANENARRIAILEQVGDDSRADTADVGIDNKDIAVCGMIIGQALDTAGAEFDESPALASRLSEPRGFEFQHPGYKTGRLFMNIEGDVVTLKLLLGSFAKKLKVSFELPLKTD